MKEHQMMNCRDCGHWDALSVFGSDDICPECGDKSEFYIKCSRCEQSALENASSLCVILMRDEANVYVCEECEQKEVPDG